MTMETENPKIQNGSARVETRRFVRADYISVSDGSADICCPQSAFVLLLEKDIVTVRRLHGTDTFYQNTEAVCVEDCDVTLPLAPGDCLAFGNIQIKIFEQDILIEADDKAYTCGLTELPIQKEPWEGFPVYKRSPRLIKNVPADGIAVSKIPAREKMGKGSLIQVILVPLLMLAVTVTISIVMKRGLFVIMSVASSVMGISASVGKYVNDRKENREKEEKRLAHYEAYLLRLRKQLNQARQEEEDAIAYNYPDTARIEKMTTGYSNRIYERSSHDDDFLTVNIGYVREKVSYPIRHSFEENAMEPDELEQEAKRLVEHFSWIDKKPVIVDLKRAHLGIVGEKENIHSQLKRIIAQLTFFHSYHDLQIINIYHSKYADTFDWQRWYPHLTIRAVNVYGNVCTEKLRDQVLGSMTQILKERRQQAEENKKESGFRPHYLFVIDEPKLMMDHAIMEYLDKEGDNLGFSIIYTSHLRANLPENIGSVLLLHHSKEGTLLLNEKKTVNRKIRLEEYDGADYERMARDLGVLVHEQGIVSQIPESVTFLAMYRAQSPKDLQIARRWAQNEAHKSLAAPLGLRATDDILSLDLHEKAHGPHGLVAGTTGSGKSEIVQSYILSLAVNFHPYEVGFLLIDYKGGGMAGLFKELPHLLGTITNLDGSESMRAMASIKSELARRQRIFSENDVNHINAYHKLFQAGKVPEPIPHLFLISDEFAELKKEQPEFMTELVSAARIGRSLGIHLILATQKPSGVVDDQIWTNSRFKLALKVQNESDSKEILKTPDAASITQVGRAYLQVGNNEIYELFQSAWSGAAYSEGQQEEEVDNRVYLVNELGQGRLVNQDLSTRADSAQFKATQLDVVVQEIKRLYEGMETIPVKKPWLPSLPGKMVSPLFPETEKAMENGGEPAMPCSLRIPIGLADIPEEQKQQEVVLDLMKDGNIVFFAAAGYGKSMFLTTLILSLALTNSVDNLNFYLCDFGNSALIALNALPHTADYINMDDTERRQKLIRLLEEEIKRRKRLFAREMVQNFDVYNQSAQEPLKAVVVIVDNYDVVREMGFELDDFFARLARDGMSLGIYMIITATRSNAVKYAALNSYKNKITGFLFDSAEYNTIMGKSAYSLPEMPGRAYVRLAAVNIMQIYSMVPFQNEVGYNAALKELVGRIQRMFPGQRAPRIPVLPERFYHTQMEKYEQKAAADLWLGLHKESVKLCGIRRSMTPFLIIGEAGKGRTNTLRVLLSQMTGRTWLFDSKSEELYDRQEQEQICYVQNDDDLEDMMTELAAECGRRKEQFAKAQQENRRIGQKEFYAALPLCSIVIDDTDDFVERTGKVARKIIECLTLAVETGILIIAAVHSGKTKGFDDVTKWFKSAANGLVLGSQGSVNLFPAVSAKEQPVLGEGLLYTGGAYEKLLLPRWSEKQSMEE